MRQVISFNKDIVFKTKIATITSIALEHVEKFSDKEVNGEFIISGDYKIHADTTEKEIFKYKLPFTTLLPDNMDANSLQVDIENFTYEVHDEDVMKICIDYVIMGDIKEEKEDKKIDEQLDQILDREEDMQQEIDITKPKQEIKEREEKQTETKEEVKEGEIITEADEYITYHIHIVGEEETLESIIKKYDTTMDTLKHYNNITSCKVGDKIIIPEKDE